MFIGVPLSIQLDLILLRLVDPREFLFSMKICIIDQKTNLWLESKWKHAGWEKSNSSGPYPAS